MTFRSSISARLAAAAFLSTAGAASAIAADFPGSFNVFAPASVRWDGYVGGAQVGLSNFTGNFGQTAGSSLIGSILSNTSLESQFSPDTWTTLPTTTTTNSRQYGFFLGFNTQWDCLVLGIDGAYDRPQSLAASSSDTVTRLVTTSDGTQHNVAVTATSSLKLIDYATGRVRAGYAMGQFLPYAAVGIAVGRFDYQTSATVTDIQTTSLGSVSQFGSITMSDGKNGAFSAGFAGALGVDVAVLPNMFLRAEWEYIAFAQLNGTRSQLNTGRVGVGLKF